MTNEQIDAPQDGDERARFDEWYASQWPLSFAAIKLDTTDDDDDVWDSYRMAELAWQAALASNNDGPGSPSARLNYLLSELHKRFPEVHGIYDSSSPEPKYLAAIDALSSNKAATVAVGEPIPILLFCPRCGTQHIDAPEDHEVDKGSHVDMIVDWSNPPHRSHLCHACELIWRPADVATTGVKAIKTRGKADAWDAAPPAPIASAEEAVPVAWKLEVPSESTRWYMSGRQAMGHWVSKDAIATPLYTHPAAAQPSRAEVLEEACAAIKAADDLQSDNDYMLDSDDCIQVIRSLKDKP